MKAYVKSTITDLTRKPTDNFVQNCLRNHSWFYIEKLTYIVFDFDKSPEKKQACRTTVAQYQLDVLRA